MIVIICDWVPTGANTYQQLPTIANHVFQYFWLVSSLNTSNFSYYRKKEEFGISRAKTSLKKRYFAGQFSSPAAYGHNSQAITARVFKENIALRTFKRKEKPKTRKITQIGENCHRRTRRKYKDVEARGA